MNTYELTYIVSAEAGESNINSIQSRVESILIENGAVKKGIGNDYTTPQKKKLSYEIGKANFGYYITVYFDAAAETIEKISKILKLDSNILRYLIVSIKGDIPQGAAVSKKEVEQQIDNAIEDMVKENKSQVLDPKIQEEPASVNLAETGEAKEEIKEIKEIKETENLENDEEKSKDSEKESEEKPKKKESKKKASFEDLDKKLDEMLN